MSTISRQVGCDCGWREDYTAGDQGSLNRALSAYDQHAAMHREKRTSWQPWERLANQVTGLRGLEPGDELRAVVEAELMLSAWWHERHGCTCGKHLK